MAKKSKKKQLLTRTDYGEQRGVSRQYIGRLIREGVIPTINDKIDPVQADAILEARREPARQTHQDRKAENAIESAAVNVSAPRPLSDSQLPTLLLKTRIKSESEKAKLLEIKAKVEGGKYVDVDEVRAAAFKQARTVRDNILNIPDRLAPVLASLNDAAEIHKKLQEELNKALAELTKKPI